MAAHRSLARLPLSIFSDLHVTSRPDQADPTDPEALRRHVCAKLRDFRPKVRPRGNAAGSGVTTVGELLKLSPLTLLRAVDPLLTNEECQEMVKRICAVCAPSPRSALSLLQQSADGALFDGNAGNRSQHHLPSGMKPLDDCLRGGFRVGTITEVVGRAGVGKTQLAMQLCVMAAKYSKGSVYIDTEKKISLRRLKEIAQEREALNNNGVSIPVGDGNDSFQYYCAPDGEVADVVDHNDDLSGASKNEKLDYKSPLEVLENVTIHSPGSTKEMLSVVSGIEEEILLRNDDASASLSLPASGPRKYPVGLLVLDSIAAPARRDFGVETAPQRVSALFQVAQILKQIADQLKVAVVVINQVGLLGDSLSRNRLYPGIDGPNRACDGSDFVAVSAALGTSWHHCVSTRLLLEHERDPHRMGTSIDAAYESSFKRSDNEGHPPDRQAWMSDRGHVRTATVVKSNVTGYSSMSFEVNVTGVCAI